jgi:hypothetical protein
VSSKETIQEIENLPPAEQAEVIRFAYRLDAERQLTGKELPLLAERMVNASDPSEALMLREAIVRGFYGGKTDAQNSLRRSSSSPLEASARSNIASRNPDRSTWPLVPTGWPQTQKFRFANGSSAFRT